MQWFSPAALKDRETSCRDPGEDEPITIGMPYTNIIGIEGSAHVRPMTYGIRELAR